MEKKYTVNELKNLVNLSHQAIYNRVEKGRLRSIVERVDSRNTTFILFTNDEWEQLINNVGLRRHIDSINNQDDSVETTFIEKPKIQAEQVELVDKIFTHFTHFTQELNQLHKDHKDELLNISKQLYLLEDSESRTKREYQEIYAENIQLKQLNQDLLNKINQLESENQQLKTKLDKKPGLLGLFRK